MWTVCIADNSHEMSSLIFSEKKYFKVSSVAVAISALRALFKTIKLLNP